MAMQLAVTVPVVKVEVVVFHPFPFHRRIQFPVGVAEEEVVEGEEEPLVAEAEAEEQVLDTVLNRSSES